VKNSDIAQKITFKKFEQIGNSKIMNIAINEHHELIERSMQEYI